MWPTMRLFPMARSPSRHWSTRVVDLMGELIAAHRPDLVVIACNTASTIVLPELRKNFAVPFVGTVPAIKPACAASVTKRVSVLGTEATVKREYTRALIRDYAQDCEVTLVGAKALAGLCRGRTARRAGGRRGVARRNRAVLPRRRRAHRYGRVGLHPLPAADRAIAAACAMAGEFHRSGAGHRAAGRRSSRAGGAAASGRHDARHFHVRPRAASRAGALSASIAEPAGSVVALTLPNLISSSASNIGFTPLVSPATLHVLGQRISGPRAGRPS